MRFEEPTGNKPAKMAKQVNNQKVRSFLTFLKSWIAPLVLVLILYYTGALAGLSVVTQSALLKTGVMDIAAEKNAPEGAASFDYDFAVSDLQGNAIDFKRFKNKVVFLNLWATWCGPCRVEMPSIQNLYHSSDTSKIKFVMLSLDIPENRQKVVNYINDKQFDFPAYVLNGPLPSQLRVPTIPTTFVIGTDGKIKSKKVGVANYDTDKFKKFLNDLTTE
jgi:thiol-disulfide isomerase/thioredoxin